MIVPLRHSLVMLPRNQIPLQKSSHGESHSLMMHINLRKNGLESYKELKTSKKTETIKPIYRNSVYIEKELSELQKKKVEMLADKIFDFNMMENRYFAIRMGERIEHFSGINPNKINMDWPDVKNQSKKTLFFITYSCWNMAS